MYPTLHKWSLGAGNTVTGFINVNGRLTPQRLVDIESVTTEFGAQYANAANGGKFKLVDEESHLHVATSLVEFKE